MEIVKYSFLDVDALDSGGNVYVADSGGDEVIVVDSTFDSVLRTLKGSWPNALVFDSSDNLYVSDKPFQQYLSLQVWR